MSSTIPEIPEEFKALSTDERIAYVQALWDFIAQSPEEIPVPEWQKEILKERLAARDNRPKATATWEGKSTRQVARPLIPLFFEPEAIADIEATRSWYGQQSPGLGTRFVNDAGATFIRIQLNPRLYPRVFPRVRRALLRQFPYIVFFEIEDGIIFVLAVLHQARSHTTIESRLG
jgi:toxin ParE1/3/4